MTEAPRNPNRVVWVRSEANAIWERIIAGERPPELTAPGSEYEATA